MDVKIQNSKKNIFSLVYQVFFNELQINCFYAAWLISGTISNTISVI
jgi:hypothetical protein